MVKIIGISGGVGSGKTTAAKMLARRGAHLIDADAIGHEALTRSDVKERIVSRWGKRVLDETGGIDRKKLGAIVFAEPNDLDDLERIVHPVILERIRDEIRQIGEKDGNQVVALDAALLHESGLVEICDGVLFVEAGPNVRSQRTESRGWARGERAARERHQMNLATKKENADWIVNNSGPPEDMEEQMDAIWRTIVTGQE